MKKVIFTIYVFIISINAIAQNIVLQENFTNYDSAAINIPAGWSISYVGNGSYYTSTASSGPSGPNSYKFGIDSATLITPAFTQADSVHFWMRGNGTDSLSALTLNYTTDQLTWQNLTIMNPIANSASMKHFELPIGTKQLQFIYSKSAGNVAFDDFLLTTNLSNIKNVANAPFTIFPIPAKGSFFVSFITPQKKPQVFLYNVLGGLVNIRTEWLSNQKLKITSSTNTVGNYFLRIVTDTGTFTSRVVLQN